MNKKENIPWVEKYRPDSFDNIVLDEYNKEILQNIINYNYFPNLLFYGPPGTGKTTTIINLINIYQEKHNQVNKGLMIHLNASDERGIDIIRNQINTFVSSKALFVKGVKFVILDEVDYMTKNAQQALKYLLEEHNDNVRFCLICNYISRIEESLQNSFVKLRFNQLPEEDIINFINKININEKLNYPYETIGYIQKKYKSDMRSMINYMQSNQDYKNNKYNIINSITYNNISNIIRRGNLKEFHNLIYDISIKYRIDINNLIIDYLSYMITENILLLNSETIDKYEFIIHNNNNFDIKNKLNYLFFCVSNVFKLS